MITNLRDMEPIIRDLNRVNLLRHNHSIIYAGRWQHDMVKPVRFRTRERRHIY